MKYPDSLNDLIDSLKELPSIGEKTAERLAFSILKKDNEYCEKFSNSIKNVKLKIKKCMKCGNLAEDDLCNICKDSSRDDGVICVVSDPKNIISFEKMGIFNGLYHVLDGLISPMDGKGPDDVLIPLLIKRVKENDVRELILAISPTIEGETTSMYITKLLENSKVKISKIAYGIPVGADLEYLDSLTLSMAFNNRNNIS